MEYERFCKSVYVPIYSQPWWMDAVCGLEGWDVWLYERGGDTVAAMPFYLEHREHGLYITKAPLTQNNGIIFKHSENAGEIARAKFEEKVIFAMDDYIESSDLAVYEQQYQTTFKNWLPFSWRGYTAIPRYTYVIEDTAELSKVWKGISAKQRSVIKKGERNTSIIEQIDPEQFYEDHSKVFMRQGIQCPFSRELWRRLETSCSEHGCCIALCARDKAGEVASLIFLVWDDKRMYHLLGGSMPGFQELDTYGGLIWRAINIAHERGVAYDFEGSMIERISKSFREYGGTPQQYFRIRKVFNEAVVRMEAEASIRKIGVMRTCSSEI